MRVSAKCASPFVGLLDGTGGTHTLILITPIQELLEPDSNAGHQTLTQHLAVLPCCPLQATSPCPWLRGADTAHPDTALLLPVPQKNHALLKM